MFLPDDARHLGQSLTYTLRDYPTPHSGIVLASLAHFTVARFGIVCNTTHSFSVFATPQKVGNYKFDNDACPTSGEDVIEIEKGLLLVCPYAGAWQHFMQDLLYKVAFAADALGDEDFSIIIESASNPAIHSVIRTMFGREELDFVAMDSGCIDLGKDCTWHVHAKNLLVAEAFPARSDLGWPPARFLRRAATRIGQNLSPVVPEYGGEERSLIVFLGRGREGECYKTPRCVRNEEEILHALNWIAKLSSSVDSAVGKITSVDSINLDRNTHTLAEAALTLRFATIVVAPHGGQTYNMIFAKPGTAFVEFVPTKRASDGPYSVHNYVSSLGHKHWLLAVPTSTHREQGDEHPFVVDARKLIRILLLEMKLLPMQTLGLTFQVSAAGEPQLDGSDRTLCLDIHWSASNLDIIIQDWCQGQRCVDLLLYKDGTWVTGIPIGTKASCTMSGVLSECVPPGLSTFQIEVSPPWRAGYDCVRSDIVRVQVDSVGGEKKMQVVEPAGPMSVAAHCSSGSASAPEDEGSEEDQEEEDAVGDDCSGSEEGCEGRSGELGIEDLPPQPPEKGGEADADGMGAGGTDDDDLVIGFRFLDLHDGKLVFPYRILVTNLRTLEVQGSFPKVFVCVDIESGRDCYEVDPARTRSEVPLTVPPHLQRPFGEYQISAFLATQSSDSTQFLPVGIVSEPTTLVWEPKLCVVVPFRDGCHGRQQGKGRAHNKQVFLEYMLRFLGRVRRNWEIIIAEQTHHGLFNKGVLFNVGAWVGENQRKCDYLTLHDVDQIPTNPQNDYGWLGDPTHMCTYSTQYTYTQWPPPPHVGGVLMATMDDYKEMNGYSNKYHGWGLEDNDQYWRLVKVFNNVERLPQTIGHYRDLPHERVMGLDMTENYNESQKVLNMLMASEGTAYTDTDGYAQILENAKIEDVQVQGKVVTVMAHVLKNGNMQGPC